MDDLNSAQGASSFTRDITGTASIGIRVYVRNAAGTETELTSDVSAVASVVGTPSYPDTTASGVTSGTWDCPQTSISTTDSVVVRVYINSGSWNALFTVTTPQLGAAVLSASTWTVYYYTETGVMYDESWQIISLLQNFGYGGSSMNSRIEGFNYAFGYAVTVNSAHGNPQGAGTYTAGQNAATSVTSPDNVDSTHRWVCTGYSIDGGSTVAGSSYTFTNVQSSHTINYYWQEQNYLTVNTVHGSVTSGNTWYTVNDVAYAGLNAGVVSGGTGIQYVFSSWSTGGTNYAQSNGITMSSAKSTTAQWTKQCQITATAGSGGSISPSGASWYNEGASQTYTITPNTGYGISQVKVDGVNQGAITSYSFTNIQDKHTIEAVFALITYAITPSVDAHSSISPATVQNVEYGSSQAFTYSANTGYTVTQVLVDGSSVPITGSYTFSNVHATHTISVSTTINSFTITASDDAHSTISPSGGVSVNYGDSKAFTYSADAGYSISQVLVDGANVSITGGYTFSSVSAGHTISVSSARNIYSNTPAVSSTVANSSSTISSYWNTGINTLSGYIFSTNNSGAWQNGTWTAFAATPAWANVTLSLNETVGKIIGYTFYANDSTGLWGTTGIQTIKASGFQILANSDSHSHISPEGTVIICAGATQSFDFWSDEGYTIENVIINGTYQASATSPFAFSDIQGNQTIAVATTTTVYSINATAGDAGCVIYPSGVILVPAGTWANFTCAAYPNYQLYDLKVNGTSMGPAAGINFIPTGNTTLFLTSTPIVVPNAPVGGGTVITIAPEATESPATEPQAAAGNKTNANNFYFVIGVILIVLVLTVVVYSKGAKKKLDTQISGWNS